MPKYIQGQIDQFRHEVRFLASQMGFQDDQVRNSLARTVFAETNPIGLGPRANKHAKAVEGSGCRDAKEQSRPVCQTRTQIKVGPSRSIRRSTRVRVQEG